MSNEASQGHHPFVPLVILTSAFFFWTGFQTVQLARERSQLNVAHANQESLIETSRTVRNALDQLAADTQRLANGGNANAKLLVEELRKRGVTINVDANRGP